MPSKIFRTAVVLILLVFAGVLVIPTAFAVEGCPQTGDWDKVDGLSGLSYTYTVDAGETLVEWCYKAGTSVIYGSANVVGPGTFTITSTVLNPNGNNYQELSHASFRVIDTPEPPCEQTNTCPPPPPDVCNNIDGVQETIPDGYIPDGNGGCVPPPPPPCEDEECPPPPDVCNNIDGVQETIPDGLVPDGNGGCVPPPTPCEETEEGCPPPRPTPPPCEDDCLPDPIPGPIGCEISPFSREDAGNWVNLTSPDGSVVYYTFPIEDRPQLGYAIVNIPTWVTSNGQPYGFYYSDGRLIGTLTVTSNAHGDLTCTWTLEVPQDPEPPVTVTVCVTCGPRIEEWYVEPETGVVGRAIDLDGVYYVEDDVAFEGSAARETPDGTVYYGMTVTVPEGVTLYDPCSVTVQLSQATINPDGTWTFTVLSMQWRSEWELAAMRFGFGQDFVDAAMATPVGGTFTVSAP